MTEIEAIEELKYDCNELGKAIPCDTSWGCSFENAYGIAIQALEKQIPKKPYHISQVDDNDNANVECPACHATTDYAVNVIKRGHCWKCGQLLDWSDEE
jgi:hypothetical protein